MNNNIGDQFKDDPRINQIKSMVVKTLLDYQSNITCVTPSNKEMDEQYSEWLSKMGEMRGRDLFFPYLSSGIGHGSLVELADGSIKYDFITGIGVHGMGHSHPKVIEACIDASMEDAVMQGNLQQSKISMDVMTLFLKAATHTGGHLKHCFLTSSGAMANENAFKIIFQKKQPANRFIAFHRCFSGRSLATAQMTDKPAYRVGVPDTFHVDYIDFYDYLNPEKSTAHSVQQLKELLAKNKDQYAGMCFELVQGEGGYYPGEHNFFVELMKVLKENNVAVMVDEIQTFGRTNCPFAFQYFNLQNYVDVVSVGKISQVCATLYTQEVNPKPGLLSQTFTSSTSALYTSKVILDEILNKDFIGDGGKIEGLSNYFRHKLQALSEQYPAVIKGPFGLGAMIAFTYKDGSLDDTKKLLFDLYKAGVLGFTAGTSPMRIRFLMPILCVTRKDIDQVTEIIEQTIQKEA